MRNWLITIAAAALLANVACGKSAAQKEAERAAEEAKKTAEAAAEAGGGAAEGMADMAKAMQGMANALGGGDGKTVEPVTFQSLQTALPSLSGWEMSEPRGERMTSPVAFSQTEAHYTKGDSRIDVKIVDTGFAQLLVAPVSMMMAMGYAKESSDGYEKATTVSGQPGFEKWEKGNKHGELTVFVGKRFLLTVEGDELADTKPLHDVVGQIDLGKLAALK